MRGIDQILAALFLIAAVVAAGAGLYAKHEHNRASELEEQVAEAKRERDGYARALDAQKAAEEKAQKRKEAASERLRHAVKGNPAVADTVVPDAVWNAIYGDSNEGN
ncbi:hypothetical protein A8D61_15690 [Burkholderia cenocepacia]|nr:hypothetical protein [Burkholderia cenocepacia]AQQ19823.1 hypothetical protein A8D61_15690 [Burkholderia cenocepacia]ONJ19567.1 hypothetical protein A8D82_11615 [Burkholderia cenocepacia]ONN80256.1 hypothetical protein A8D63_31465 [Burkholderia cenocepacia]ONN80498.1 hypothetical protein A8D62_33380 [Burkholderia cenocepacia]ONN90290.1 hypothetical protein A8D64_11875 [Burkholderia cenocepacia]